MEGGFPPSDAAIAPYVRTAHAPCGAGDVGDGSAAIASIAADLGPGPFGLIALFVSPEADFGAVAAEARQAFPGAPLIGCTTAGEISPLGYTSGEVVAVGFPAAHFAAAATLIEDLAALDRRAIAADLMAARADLAHERAGWPYEFAFLLIDGLSMREEEVGAAVSAALGPVPSFGGSAGDGLAFESTFVMMDGEARQDAAVVAVIRTRCPIAPFRLDHHAPTAEKMVVTGADPARRVVTEINAEPAAREYARILGKDPEQLSPFIFAAHPVLVRIGGEHHVRAIRKVEPNGELVFFSAIDEGLVLTLAEPKDIADHLEAALGDLAADRKPTAIVACDCLLRRVEAEQKQAVGRLSSILVDHGVVGFNTYGEQSNGAHVNQTITGVAFYAPDAA